MAWKSGALGIAMAAATAFLPAHAWQLPKLDFGNHAVSADTRKLANWVTQSGDHRARPFAIVDKKGARIYVFDSAGRLRGTSSALLGQAVGDEIAPEVGAHAQAGYVPPHERTTPAGRFPSEPGRNDSGEHVVWVHYESAFAIHRLRPGASHDARAKRLGAGVPADSRVSYGCVVVPVEFYVKTVVPLLGRQRSIVYVLPESGNWRALPDSL